MTLYVVTGPPCSGKSTYVRRYSKIGDMVVDLDRIALAIGDESTPHHQYPLHIRNSAVRIRKLVVEHAIQWHKTGGTSFIIHARPSNAAISNYRALKARFVPLNAPTEVLLERARLHRPGWVSEAIMNWNEPTEW